MIAPPSSLRLAGKRAAVFEHGIVAEEGTDPALVRVLRTIPNNVRLNFWFGNPTTGQSFGHALSQWGSYLSLRPLANYAKRCEGWLCFRTTKRIDASADYPLATESLLLVTTASGTNVYYKHPLYCPVHD